MNGQRIPEKRWQLQQDSDADQWKLLDSEQQLDERWQLQADTEYDAYQGRDWQPIDYAPEERSGGNWVLPSLVLVAVLAVAGYVGVVGLDRIGLSGFDLNSLLGFPARESAEPTTPDGNSGEPDVTGPITNTGQALPVADPPTPTLEPPTATPTEVPPTPTQVPLIEQRTATVRDQYGVNARRTPSTDGEKILVVPFGTGLPVWSEEDNSEGKWFQVSLPDKTLAWVASNFVDVTAQSITYDQANALRTENNQPLLPTPAPPSAPAVEQPAAPAADAGQPSATTPAGAAISLSAVVSSPAGLNLRATPDTAGTAVTLLENGKAYNAVGRSADSQWIQLQLADGQLGWAATQFLVITGDLNTLPSGGITASPAATQTLTNTTAITETTQPGLTEPVTPTSSTVTTTTDTTTGSATTVVSGTTGTTTLPAPSTTTTTTTAPNSTDTTTTTTSTQPATAKVIALSGARVRATPQKDGADVTILPFNAIVSVSGRSSDSAYVQVTLEDGNSGWVLVTNLELSVALETLTVRQ